MSMDDYYLVSFLNFFLKRQMTPYQNIKNVIYLVVKMEEFIFKLSL
jgi:hypothetical protein